MTDVFAAYAHQARTLTTHPQPLLGPIKLRADARTRYAEIVTALDGCSTRAELDAYLESVRRELAQFAAALEFLWSGSDSFNGLKKEIEWATARVDDGLDFPRWEPGYPLTASLDAVISEAEKETRT